MKERGVRVATEPFWISVVGAVHTTRRGVSKLHSNGHSHACYVEHWVPLVSYNSRSYWSRNYLIPVRHVFDTPMFRSFNSRKRAIRMNFTYSN